MPSQSFPARFEFLDEIREFVAEVARQGGFSDKAVYSLQLAADEAASNVIEHAYQGNAEGILDVSCAMQGQEIVITLRDTGKSFNLSNVKEPNLKADLTEREIGGLGVYLMRKLMDSVHYESSKSGNTLIMKKRRE